MGISAVILTHNSASSIRRVIRSVSFCDEVIVVDDASADGTVSIARAAGATVLTRNVAEDFAAQRNFALEKATGPWVLYIDADETVPDDLAQEIRKATARIDVNGFFLKRRDTMWGRTLNHGETENVRLMRLAQKGKGTWKRPVHEVWDVTGIVGTLEHPLLHAPHPDVAQFLSSVNRYSTINARYLFGSGVRVSWWHIPAYPVAKFIQNYFVRQGFRDGMPGMLVALMMSFHSFLSRAKLWQLSYTRSH